MSDVTTLKEELETEHRLRREAEAKVEALTEFMRKKMVEFEAYGQKVAEAFAAKDATEKELRARIKALEAAVERLPKQ
jgi:hypothetical protein